MFCGGIGYTFFLNMYVIAFMPSAMWLGSILQPVVEYLVIMPAFCFYVIIIVPFFLTIFGYFFRLIGKSWSFMWYPFFERYVCIGNGIRWCGCFLLWSRRFFFFIGLIGIILILFLLLLLYNLEYIGVIYPFPEIDANIFYGVFEKAYVHWQFEMSFRDYGMERLLWFKACQDLFLMEFFRWLLFFYKVCSIFSPSACWGFMLFFICLKCDVYQRLKSFRDPNMTGTYFCIKRYTIGLCIFLNGLYLYLFFFFMGALLLNASAGAFVAVYPDIYAYCVLLSFGKGPVVVYLISDLCGILLTFFVYCVIMLVLYILYICPDSFIYLFIVFILVCFILVCFIMLLVFLFF